MIQKKDLIFILDKGKRKLEIITKRINFSVYSFILLVFLSFIYLNIPSAEAVVMQNDKLIERISKDYTNKFCNSIAFGLSKESAMNFANKENNIIFKKKKGRADLNQQLLKNTIAVSVVEKCGFLIDLRGDEGITKFENDYELMNNS